MQKKWIWLCLILSMAFNVAFLGALGYRLWTRKHGPPAREEFARRTPPREGPGLRQEQKERFDAMHKEFFPRIRAIRVQLRSERDALAALLKEENPDTNRIHARLDKISGLQAQIEKQVVFQMLKEKAILDPPQREAFVQRILRRMGEREPGPGRDPRWKPPGAPGDREKPWQNHESNTEEKRKEPQP